MLKILIEGPDCAGKSTIARRLHETLANSVMWERTTPSSAPGEVLLEKVDDFFHELRNNRAEIKIYDRFHFPSDVVYSPLFNNKPSPLFSGLQRYIGLCDHEELVILYVKASKEAIAERYGERGDKYLVLKDILTAVDGYETLMARLPNVITIDTTESTIEEACTLAEQALKEAVS